MARGGLTGTDAKKRRGGRGRAGRAGAGALSLVLAALFACALAASAAPGLAAAAGLASDGVGVGAALDADAGDAYAEDEIIIVYENEATDLASEAIVAEEELVAASEDAGAVTVATIAEGASVEELCEELASEDGVASVQPNYEYTLLDTAVDDPYAVADATAEYNQYYLFASGFTSAWDLSQAAGTVTVAVLDTGCSLSHEDLAATVDAELAYDVVSDTLLSEAGLENDGDEDGHGTMVCGIVSAVANNALGIAGASYNASVLPVRIYSGTSAKTSDVVAAYAYLDGLIESGELSTLRVINISLGTYSASASGDTALHQAIASMLSEHDVLTVCAGGNGATSAYIYPADFVECVSVTAVAADSTPAAYTDHNDAKDISAYGDAILSTSAEGGYAYGSGTSYAAPQVAAAAALLWAANPTLTSEEVVAALQATADAVVDEYENNGSAGILDAAEAVAVALDADALSAAVDAAANQDAVAEADDEAEDEASGEDDGEGASDDGTADEDASGSGGSANTGDDDASGSEDEGAADSDASDSSDGAEGSEESTATSDDDSATGADDADGSTASDGDEAAAEDDLVLLDDAETLPASGDATLSAVPAALLGLVLLALAISQRGPKPSWDRRDRWDG